MDSLITSAARSLATGDPLGALQRVALRDDPPALALRGIAMAQLGEYERARKLLRRAARAFGNRERLARARCQVAEAEVSLAARDLHLAVAKLEPAMDTLHELGDRANALFARVIMARHWLLVGELDAAETALDAIGPAQVSPPALAARIALTRAEIELRRVRVAAATAALDRAERAVAAAGIPGLSAEIQRARQTLSAPAARLVHDGETRPVCLHEVESVLASGNLVVDACRRAVRGPAGEVSLAGRAVLFALVGALAEAWPADLSRDRLIERAFRVRTAEESYRARLRVELSRLRTELRRLAGIEATRHGFRLVPVDAAEVVILAPPVDGPDGAVLALLGAGESWSTLAIASALGVSQRTVQRSLARLEASKTVRSVGHGRSRRWLVSALSEFATTLLLPGVLPIE